MTPFYERDGITIYCGETLATMAQLDGPFDAIIADLPYGTTACGWDTVIPFELLWKQYKRLTTGAVVLFGGQPFTSALVMSCPEWFKYVWVWEKDKAANILNANRQPLKVVEDIAVFYKGQCVYNPQKEPCKPYKHKGRRVQSDNFGQNADSYNPEEYTVYTTRHPRNVLYFAKANGGKGALHPTQKPVALLAYLIRTYTNPGEIILDNTMGSGTTLVAAQQEGRRATGIDISEDYCKIAVERLRQRSLWQIEPVEEKQLEHEQATLL